MKKAIYIDCDGTLTTDHLWRSLPETDRIAVQKFLFGGDRVYMNNWMRGKYSSEEANQYVASGLGLSYEYLWDIFVEDCKNLYIDPKLLDEIKRLNKTYVTILMSGNMDCFTRFTIPALNLTKYFDHTSISFDEGLHKTDNNGELFSKWETKTSVPLGNSLLLDDQQQVLDIFSDLGGKPLKTTGPVDSLEILRSL